MSREKENWYRTGAVAKALGTSPHKIRELARADLIESQVRNGYRYFPGREVERLRNEGLPAMPANAAVDDDSEESDNPDEGRQVRAEGRSAARSRLTQDLYAEPSPQLVKSKEKLVRLEHNLEAKKLLQQSRELDRAAQEEQMRAHERQMTQEWRDGYLRRVVEKVPARLCVGVCAKVEDLLSSVPPRSNVTAKVDEIIENALFPLKREEQQQRATEETLRRRLDRDAQANHRLKAEARSRIENAIRKLPERADYREMCAAANATIDEINAVFDHRRRVRREVQSFTLPYGATPQEREQAQDLAQIALSDSEAVPVGASDRQLRRVLDSAIATTVEQINRRQAQEQNRRVLEDHKRRIDQTVLWLSLCMPPEATPAEIDQATRTVRAALEQLPPTADQTKFNAEKDKAFAPIRAGIEQRKAIARHKEEESRARERDQRAREWERQRAEQRADSYLSRVETRLRELENEGDIDFEDCFDLWRLRDKVKQKIRPIFVQQLCDNPKLSDAEIQGCIEDLVDENFEEFCD
jgi:hypothetical protein